MAAKFPIQFAETLPTGRAAVVPARLDVRTGAEEMARAVSGFGAALFESGRRIADAQKAMEISAFKRREEEFRLSALQALKAPGFDVNDDEAVAALKEKTNADRDTLVSKWQSVNDTYQMYRNNIEPRWGIQFESAVQDIKARNVRDEFNLNAENLLGKGNLFEYQTLLEISLTTDVISKAEYDFRTKSAPNDSILQQMRIQIGNNNPQGAIELSGQMADPSADQMEYRNRLIRMAEQAARINTDAVENEIIYGMHTNKDRTIAERATIGENYITTLKLANISPTRFDKLIGDIEQWMTGEERPNDSMVYVDLIKDVERLKSGVGDPTEVRRKIRDSYSKLDDRHFESITKLLEADIPSFQAGEIRKIIRYAERQLVTMDESTWMMAIRVMRGRELEDATSKRQLEFWNLSEYDKELNDWVAKNPDATRDEIYVQSRKLLAHYRRRTIPQIEKLLKAEEAAILTTEETEKRAELAIRKENRIKVRSPDGNLFTIPESQREAAVNQGYMIVE